MCSPKISERLVPKIYKAAKAKGIPMTKVLDGILEETLTKIGEETASCKV